MNYTCIYSKYFVFLLMNFLFPQRIIAELSRGKVGGM